MNKCVALLSVCRMTSRPPAIIILELEGEDGATAQVVNWQQMRRNGIKVGETAEKAVKWQRSR